MYTVKRIAKLLLFYFFFYSGLAAYVAVLTFIFLKTLNADEPKWQLDESLIGSNPGLGFKPNAGGFADRTNLISYNVFNNETATGWTQQLDKFLEHYITPEYSDNLMQCDYLHSAVPNKVCEFKISEYWGPCTKEYGYGFNLNSTGPCIFFKLNKVFGWVPDFYSSTTLPDDMPEVLKNWIKHSELQGRHKNVWLDCSGKTPSDTENMGNLTYYPHRGFPSYYFPFQNTKGYLSPLVVVHFENPKRSVTIDVICKAWARNIQHHYLEQKGSVRIRLLLTEEDTK